MADEIPAAIQVGGLEKLDVRQNAASYHAATHFAVEMLLAGAPIDQVSMLLGCPSVKITEKHYWPSVKARQEQLAASVRNAWSTLVAVPPPKPNKKAKVLAIAG